MMICAFLFLFSLALATEEDVGIDGLVKIDGGGQGCIFKRIRRSRRNLILDAIDNLEEEFPFYLEEAFDLKEDPVGIPAVPANPSSDASCDYREQAKQKSQATRDRLAKSCCPDTLGTLVPAPSKLYTTAPCTVVKNMKTNPCIMPKDKSQQSVNEAVLQLAMKLADECCVVAPPLVPGSPAAAAGSNPAAAASNAAASGSNGEESQVGSYSVDESSDEPIVDGKVPEASTSLFLLASIALNAFGLAYACGRCTAKREGDSYAKLVEDE